MSKQMTVAELAAFLRKVPNQNAPIIIQYEEQDGWCGEDYLQSEITYNEKAVVAKTCSVEATP